MHRTSIKGLDSYRIEDGVFFYGRDADAERLVSRLLSSRFLLLHARSGAGKTSLLQARAVSDLETQGWFVALARPGRHPDGSSPTRAVQTDVVKALAPPPAAEMKAIARALRMLFWRNSTGGLTLQHLIDAYRERRELAQPRAGADAAGCERLVRRLQSPVRLACINGEAEEYYPQFNAVLRGGVGPADYLRHVAACRAEPPGPDAQDQAGQLPVTELLARLAEAHAGLSAALLGVLDAPARTLSDFFARVFTVYGKWRPDLKLALVLDQFEELFTLYGDRGSTAIPDITPGAADDVHSYTLRDEFLAQLQQLYARMGAPSPSADQRTATAPLPLCCVISIRQEFIAELDPVRAFASDLDQWSVHLERLQTDVARSVLADITRQTPWPFSERLAGRIACGLTREGRFVDPAELQVVAARIMDESRPASPGAAPLYAGPEEAFEKLGSAPARPGCDTPPDDGERVRVILSRFFHEFLDRASGPPERPQERKRTRLELLEILQSLITDRGKAPAPVHLLIEAPFRNRRRRQELLDVLEQHRIIRRESKSGMMMAEIRHDFLIRPIQRLVREELRTEEYGRLVSAQAILSSRIEFLSDDAGRNLLTRQEFDDISRYRETLSWEYSLERWRWTPAELMLRTALTFRDISADTLQIWFEHTGESYRARDRRRDRAALLNRETLPEINRHPDGISFTRDELATVIRRHLELCREDERKWIEYWTERWIALMKGDEHV